MPEKPPKSHERGHHLSQIGSFKHLQFYPRSVARSWLICSQNCNSFYVSHMLKICCTVRSSQQVSYHGSSSYTTWKKWEGYYQSSAWQWQLPPAVHPYTRASNVWWCPWKSRTYWWKFPVVCSATCYRWPDRMQLSHLQEEMHMADGTPGKHDLQPAHFM